MVVPIYAPNDDPAEIEHPIVLPILLLEDVHDSQTNSTGISRKSARKGNISPTPPKLIPKNPKKPTPVKVNIPHQDQIPIWMYDFIEKVRDVPGDGHCGFRAVAVLRNLSVDDHQIVRYTFTKSLLV